MLVYFFYYQFMYVPWPGHFPQPETPSGAPHQRPAYLIYDILGNYDDLKKNHS